MGARKTSKHSTLVWPVLVTLLVISWCPPSEAEPIRYAYGGVITTADPSTGIVAGTRFDGTFTYDPAAPVTDPLPSIEGQIGYGSFGGPSGLVLNVGGHQFLEVRNLGLTVDYGPKYLPTPSAQDPAMTGVSVLAMTDQYAVTLSLTNTNREVFPPSPIPTSFSLDDFPVRQLLVVDRASHGGVTLLGGQIDTLTPLPVPEPTPLATILVVTGGLAFRRYLGRR